MVNDMSVYLPFRVFREFRSYPKYVALWSKPLCSFLSTTVPVIPRGTQDSLLRVSP